MSTLREANPAKLVVGLFTGHKSCFEKVTCKLVQRFGDIDMASPWLPFDDTDYYETEMGAPLFRRFAVFSRLIPQDGLAEIKLFTNELECEFTEDGRREVNIDPGYVTAERFVLATGKNYTHRIYLDSGVYADLTLVYHKADFRSLPWTYPDYAKNRIRSFLRTVRDRYMRQMKM